MFQQHNQADGGNGMVLKVQIKTIDYLTKLVAGSTDQIKGAEYSPQKVLYNAVTKSKKPLKEARPEEEGISPKYLAEFFKEAAKDRQIDAHGILILRHGNIIARASFYPYQEDIWHISHSMCKSLTGLAIGLLIEDGVLELDEKLLDIFKEKRNLLSTFRLKDITVRHLLTMSSGITVNEAGAILENDWVKMVMESSTAFNAGEKFSYNSMNTYILSAIIKEKTEKGLTEFLQERIFAPLEITQFYWEKCPKGIEKGGWGLSIRLEDMAKIGQLYLQMGEWEGRQLVAREWIEESTKMQIDTSPDSDRYGYGYQICIGPYPGSYQFNGMLGQNVIVLPDREMVIATTGGSSGLNGATDISPLIYQYFTDAKFKPEKAIEREEKEYQNLQKVLRHLKYHEAYQDSIEISAKKLKENRRKNSGWKKREKEKNWELEWVKGKTYIMEDSNIGIMPLFLQCLHNNYGKGIKEIAFMKKGTELFLHILEGEKEFSFPVRADEKGYKNTVLDFSGEIYQAAVKGNFTRDEEDRIVLKLTICFLETSNTRLLKIIFYPDDTIKICFDELPHLQDLMKGVSYVLDSPVIEQLKLKDAGYAKYKMGYAMCPEIIGKLKID